MHALTYKKITSNETAVFLDTRKLGTIRIAGPSRFRFYPFDTKRRIITTSSLTECKKEIERTSI